MDTAPVRKRGRRSLNGAGDSPQLRVRLSDDLRESLSRRAAHEGVTVSELARRVLADSTKSSTRTDQRTRREERVQLELHRALLGHLLSDLGPVQERARHNIEGMRAKVRGGQAQAWLDEWSELIEHAGPALIEVFLGEDEHSVDMRQVSPFAGVLPQPERLTAIERASSSAAR